MQISNLSLYEHSRSAHTHPAPVGPAFSPAFMFLYSSLNPSQPNPFLNMRLNKTLSTLTRRLRGRSLLLGLAALAWGGTAKAQYCASQANSTYALCRVDFADMTSAPSSGAGYLDNTALVASVAAGNGYTLSVSSATNYGWYISAFFDWDNNGTFETKVNVGVAGTCPGAPLTGTINVPGSAVNGTSRMRIMVEYQGFTTITDGCGNTTYGQTIDYSVLVGPPPTCLAPTLPVVSNITTSTADLAWTASTSGPSSGYQWEVRASGNPGDPSPAASGTAAGTTASASGLTGGIATYKLYVRADCGGGDLSSWKASAAFETATSLSCGTTWVSPNAANDLTDVRFVKTWTICPGTSGEVATLDFTTWNGLNWNVPQKSGIFIYNGDNTSAPQVMGPGVAYSETGWSIPAGGWTSNNTTNKPPITTSTAVNGCLTVKVYSFGIWTGGMGWSANVTCAPPPTCFPPTGISVVTSTSGGTFSFTGTSTTYEYKVVAAGGASIDAAIVSGTSASSPAVITGLTAGTAYTAYFRGDCGGGDLSAWSPVGKNFRTVAGCDGPVNLFSSSAYAEYTPIPTGGRDSVVVICPNNAGDVVTINMTKFSFGGGGNGVVGVSVHNGNSIAAPIFSSGLPAKTYVSSTLPAGAYWGDTYRVPGSGVLPGPFTSSAANGCLTVHFQAFSPSTYDQGMTSTITCAPAPACSTPNNVTFSNIGGTSATVTWGNTSQPCIVEYGPAVGFTPGTGATAGTNGIIATSNGTSPYSLTGLSATTSYKVYVRQVCSGPSYSVNSYNAGFSTSMDCSTATVLSCASFVTATFTGNPGSAAYSSTEFTQAPTCFAGYSPLNGEEFMYRITAPITGTYQLSFERTSGTGDEYFLTTPVANGCGASAFTCIGGSYYPQEYAYATSHATGAYAFNLTAGDHYIIMKGNPSPKTVNFRVLCPGLPACVIAPTFPANGTTLAVNSTPILFSWPAAFGATGYDFYFNGSLLVSNYSGTSISDPSYTSAAVAGLVGLGNPVSWHVVPRNTTYGVATCPTEWTFRTGGNGAANAIPLTEGVAYSGNRNLANGYTNANTTYNGRDSWYKFTASACADSARINICLAVGVNAVALSVVRVSDAVVVFPPTGYTTPTTPYYQAVASGACFKFSYYNYDISNYVLQTPIFPVVPGETYRVIVDGYATDYNFQVSYNEVIDTTDTDGDGLADCVDNCPETPGEEGDPCEVGPLFTYGVISGCECVGVGPIPCTTDLVLEFQTDANPGQTTWEIREQGTNFLVSSGGPLNPQNSTETNTTCLPDGCFDLTVFDSAGDGMTTGGYILRTDAGMRIIDNANNFSTGFSSTISGGQGFCVPLSDDELIFSSCDKMDWVNYKYLVAHSNAAVSAEWVPSGANSVQDANSGYEFWIFDPNGSYSYRRFHAHNVSDGFSPASATRAARMKINGWYNGTLTPLIPQNKVLNVRVRGRVNGVNGAFGPACRMMLNAAAAACPVTNLQDDPANTNDFSCGVVRNFGGNNSGANKIVANPPQFVPVVQSNQVRFQFRFRLPAEGVCIVRPVQASPTLYLNWSAASGPQLQATKTYEVEVRASKDQGATWCAGGTTPACDATPATWGKACSVTIGSVVTLQGGNSNMTIPNTGTLNMYPNPNNGDQLTISLTEVARDVRTMSVDIYDLTGKRITARTIAVQDGSVTTVLDLNSEISNGLYMVNITAGEKTYTERLVIQH